MVWLFLDILLWKYIGYEILKAFLVSRRTAKVSGCVLENIKFKSVIRRQKYNFTKYTKKRKKYQRCQHHQISGIFEIPGSFLTAGALEPVCLYNQNWLYIHLLKFWNKMSSCNYKSQNQESKMCNRFFPPPHPLILHKTLQLQDASVLGKRISLMLGIRSPGIKLLCFKAKYKRYAIGIPK